MILSHYIHYLRKREIYVFILRFGCEWVVHAWLWVYVSMYVLARLISLIWREVSSENWYLIIFAWNLMMADENHLGQWFTKIRGLLPARSEHNLLYIKLYFAFKIREIRRHFKTIKNFNKSFYIFLCQLNVGKLI